MPLRVEIATSISSSRAKRHDLRQGEFVQLPDGRIQINTPLVKMTFDPGGAMAFCTC